MLKYKLKLSSDLEKKEIEEYKRLLKEAESEPFFYGDGVDEKRERQIVIDLKINKVVGFFQVGVKEWSGRIYHRTGSPYVGRAFRGRGIMKSVLSDWYKGKELGLAWIDDVNFISIALFTSLGFKKFKPLKSKKANGHWYVKGTFPKEEKPVYSVW